MASSKCNIQNCKRDFDTLCAHCLVNFCTKHYIEHAKLASDELIPLADQLNAILNSVQQCNPLYQAFEQLEQWREINHRYIDKLCNDKKRELQVEVQQRAEKQMSKLRELSRQVKEMIDEGDASFKQIAKIKRDLEECQQQCKEFEKIDYVQLNLKPIEIEMHFTNRELFTGGGTLLSLEQQNKLNEFCDREGQRWILVYKATRDGFGSYDFHRCCDNQGPTITIIQSKEDGYLFGGYTSVSWRSTGQYIADYNGPFLFTLTNPHGIPPTKYIIANTEDSICDNKNFGPTFGNGPDLFVCNDSQSNRDSYFDFPRSYSDTTNRRSRTFTGTKEFQTNDIEVYRLLNN